MSSDTQITASWPDNNAAFVSSGAPPSSSAHTVGAGATEKNSSDRHFLIILSAKSRLSLEQTKAGLVGWIRTKNPWKTFLSSLSYTLSCRRTNFNFRYATVVRKYEDLVEQLSQTRKPENAASNPSITFVFTGQGAQWHAMGRDLLYNCSVYRKSLTKSRDILIGLGASWDLLSELGRDKNNSRMNEAELAQPSTTAIQIALVDLLRSFGISPSNLIGHSSGEIAAAYAGGVLDQESALTVAYHRGFVPAICRARLGIKGAMLAVNLGAEEVVSYINKVSHDTVVIACENSSSSTTLSGDKTSLDEIRDELNADEIFNRILHVDTAYHSHHTKAAASQYRHCIAQVRHTHLEGSINFVSTVTGAQKTGGFDCDYWVQNLTSQVKFYSALKALLAAEFPGRAEHKNHVLIEIGPRSALASPIKHTVAQFHGDNYRIAYCPSLTSNQPANRAMLDLIGTLYEKGASLDFSGQDLMYDLDQYELLTDMPSYRWDHSKVFWHESRLSRQHRFRRFPHHTLLGISDAGSTSLTHRWRNIISLKRLPWLHECRMNGSTMFPLAGYICMALEALRQVNTDEKSQDRIGRYNFYRIHHTYPLIVEEEKDLELEFCLSRNGTNRWGFQVSLISQSDGSSSLCTGQVHATTIAALDISHSMMSSNSIHLKCHQSIAPGSELRAEEFEPAALYSYLATHGTKYGPSFQRVASLKLQDWTATGMLQSVNFKSSSFEVADSFVFADVSMVEALFHPLHTLLASRAIQSATVIDYIESMVVDLTVPVSQQDDLCISTTVDKDTLDYEAEIIIRTWEDRTILEMFGIKTHKSEDPTIVSGKGAASYARYDLKWAPDVDFTLQINEQSLLRTDTGTSLTSKEKIAKLNWAARTYIKRCLERGDLEQHATSRTHISYFTRWMKYIQEKYAEGFGSNGVEYVASDSMNSSVLWALGPEGELLSKIGSSLFEIISETVLPLTIMLENDLLLKFYQSELFHASYSQMQKYVESLSFKNPRLSVLEIGAGTAGATRPLLASMTRNGIPLLKEYFFTDISPGFFNRARDVLGAWQSVLTFKVLDISKPPIEQGFEARKYDLIVAANVLHATASITSTLRNVRQLLKPSGRLLLVELTEPHPFIGLIFGTLPGWWEGYGEGRTNGPLLSLAAWNQALQDSGFEGVHVASADHAGEIPNAYFIISKARATGVKLQTLSINISSGSTTRCQRLLHLLQNDLRFLDRINTKSTAKNEKEGSNAGLTHLAEGYSITVNVQQGRSIDDHVLIELEAVALDENLSQQQASKCHSLKILVSVTAQSQIDHRLLNALDYLLQSISQSYYNIDNAAAQDFFYHNGELFLPRLAYVESIGKSYKLATMVEPNHLGVSDKLASLANSHKIREPMSTINTNRSRSQTSDGKATIHMSRSFLGRDDSLDYTTLQHTMLSHEGCVGTVLALSGAYDAAISIGDQVYSPGSHRVSELLEISLENIYKLPEPVTKLEQLCIMTSCIVAYDFLTRLANLNIGHKTLVAGPDDNMKLATILIAAIKSLEIYVVASSLEEQDRLVNKLKIPRSRVLPPDIHLCKRIIQEFTSSQGVDVVVLTGSCHEYSELLSCVSHHGVCVLVNLEQDKAIDPPASPATKQASTFHITRKTYTTNSHIAVSNYVSEIKDLLKAYQLADILSLKTVEELDTSVYKPTVESERLCNVVFECSTQTKKSGPRQQYDICNGTKASVYLIVTTRTNRIEEETIRLVTQILSIEKSIIIVANRVAHTDKEIKNGYDETSTIEYCEWRTIEDIVDHVRLYVNDAEKDLRGLIEIQAVSALTQASFQEKTTHLRDHLPTVPFTKIACGADLNCFREELRHGSLTTFKSNSEQSPAGNENYFISRLFNAIHSAIQEDGTLWSTDRETNHLLWLSIQFWSKQDQSWIQQDARSVVIVEQELAAQLRDEDEIPWILNVPVNSRDDIDKPDRTLTKQEGSYNDRSQPSTSAESKQIPLVDGIIEIVSSLVSRDREQITTNSNLHELGFDSLIAVELSRRISSELEIHVDVGELLDTSSIETLGNMLSNRVRRITSEGDALPESSRLQKRTDMPSLPLPALSATMDQYLNSVKAFVSDIEYQEVVSSIDKFLAPQGEGLILQNELENIQKNHNVINWLSELYISFNHLQNRFPTPFNSWFGIYDVMPATNQQAHRAAVITLTALEFESDLQSNRVDQDYLNELPLCMNLLPWLFGAARIPSLHADSMYRSQEATHIAVLRSGRVYQISLQKSAAGLSYGTLRTVFEEILEKKKINLTSPCILSMGNRDLWANTRNDAGMTDEKLQTYFKVLDSATVLVCLDDDSPTTIDERYFQFIFAGTSQSRWADKTLQFVVCRNGVSGYIAEHSMLDGSTLKQLNERIQHALVTYRRLPLQHQIGIDETLSFEEINAPITDALKQKIDSISFNFRFKGNLLKPAMVSYDQFGSSLTRSHKLSPKSCFQMALQLASYLYHGDLVPSWETVSTRSFAEGRVELLQTVVPEVLSFCHAVDPTDMGSEDVYRLLVKAVQVNATMVVNASRGRGYERHLSALKEVAHRMGRSIPSIFTNPVYNRTRIGRMLVDCSEMNVQEMGGIWGEEADENLWIHFEMDVQSTKVWVVGTKGIVEEFIECLTKAELLIRQLLN